MKNYHYVKCNVCRSLKYKTLFKKFLEDRDLLYTVVKCRECGFVFVNPRLKINQMDISQISHREGHNRFDESVARIDEHQANNRLQIVLKDQGLNVSGRRILDVGCAHGIFLALARKKGFEPTGIAPDGVYAEFGRKYHILDIHNDFLENVFLPENYFDAITLWSALDHFDDPLMNLKKCYKALKNGGRLYIEVGNFHGISTYIRQPFLSIIPPEHLSCFTVASLERILRKAEFNQVVVKTKGFNIHTVSKGIPSFNVRKAVENYINLSHKRPFIVKMMREIVSSLLNIAHLGDGILAISKKC